MYSPVFRAPLEWKVNYSTSSWAQRRLFGPVKLVADMLCLPANSVTFL